MTFTSRTIDRRLVRRGATRRRCSLVAWCTAGTIAALVPSAFARSASDARVLKDLHQLVAAPGGPPGAIVTLFRRGRTIVLSAGVARVGARRPPRATDHMRIASIAKAFSGAIVLQLAQQRRLGLDDTIARRAPGCRERGHGSRSASFSTTPAAFPTTPSPTAFAVSSTPTRPAMCRRDASSRG